MTGRLDGKVALVTGASSGIGWETAVGLGREGAAVGVCYRSNEDGAREARRAIEESGGKATVIQGDISIEDDARRTVSELRDAFGQINVLVNNAGMENQRPFLEMSLDDWEKVVSVNLTGAFLMSREALRYMVDAGGGVIVNISSVHERIPWPGYAHYAASKGGLKLLTETLALEFAGRGVRVNSVAPGAIATPINREKLEDPDLQEKVGRLIPQNRMGEPEEVASCVAFLASDEAAYVTGATLFVDGGLSLYPSFEGGGI